MANDTVTDWRHAIRFRIDGQQFQYDGQGEFRALHATVFQYADDGKRYWKVEVLEESSDRSRAEAYTYGDTLPLTHKMATEIARRFVTGKKIPKRLEWR
jgi:hypothetical protein